MLKWVASAARLVRDAFRSRAELAAENEFLRQQLGVARRQLSRVRPTRSERARLAFLARLFCWREREALHLVQPETLIRWHRQGWKLYWTWRSRRRGRHACRGRRVSEDVRALVRDMAQRNTQGRPWGARRIVGELKKLGFSVSRRTVQRILSEEGPRSPPTGQRWSTFVRNHLPELWACDLFTVTTLTFRQLHVFFVLRLDTRQVVQVGVTEHPTDAWLAQQLRNVLPWHERPPRFLIRDRDRKFGNKFETVLRDEGVGTLLTPPRQPVANAFAERLVGTLRQELLDHVLIRSEEHLRWLLSEFLAYHHGERPHQGLVQQVPDDVARGRVRPSAGPVRRHEILNGLIHTYSRTPLVPAA